MKDVVYYFTRTGTSEKIAKEIGEKKGAEVFKITDNKNWKGVFGFIKAAYYSVNKKVVPASYTKPDKEDNIILVMPLWADGFPPAVRKFINDIGRENITLVVTSMSTKIKEREGFKKVIDVIGQEEAALDI